MKLIDKDALVAEINRVLNSYGPNEITSGRYALVNLRNFLDTLEVKEVQETTASDRGMAEEIIINLKRVEQDYRIDLTKEMEWLRNKVKKGKDV